MRRRNTTIERPVASNAILVPDVARAERTTRLGDIVVEAGLASREVVENVARSRATGERLGAALIEQGVIDGSDVTRALSEQLHIPIVDLRNAKPEPEA